MTTINDLYSIDAEAMMTLSELGFAAYERKKEATLKTWSKSPVGDSMIRIELSAWLADRANNELDLSHRIKCAPKRKAMA